MYTDLVNDPADKESLNSAASKTKGRPDNGKEVSAPTVTTADSEAFQKHQSSKYQSPEHKSSKHKSSKHNNEYLKPVTETIGETPYFSVTNLVVGIYKGYRY